MQIDIGKIELNGITFGKDIRMDGLLGNPKFHSFRDNDGHIDIFSSEQVKVDGYTFNVEITFLDKQIDTIELIPVNLVVDDPGYPDEKYQKEKKKVTDNFLRAQLGEPLRANEAVLYYEFDWGSVASIAFYSGRNEYTGGFIEISYKK